MARKRRKTTNLFSQSARNNMIENLRIFCKHNHKTTLEDMDFFIDHNCDKYKTYGDVIEAALLNYKNSDFPDGITNYNQIKRLKKQIKLGNFFNTIITDFMDL